MGVFRYLDRWQGSIRDIWKRDDQVERLMALLEQRDIDLENWLEQTVGRTLRCEARPSGSQALTTSVGAAVQLTSENTDTSGIHDNSTNNTRFTAPIGGTYFVSYTMDIAATAGGDRAFWFIKNGGSVRYAATNAIGTTSRHEACGSCDIELDAGDYVELVAFQASGVSLFVGTQSWCAVQIRYVGPVTA